MFNEGCPAPGIWCQHRGIALPVFTLAVRIQMLAIWRGESQVATGLGSAAHDPCAGTASPVFVVMSRRASGRRGSGAAGRHTKVTGFSPSHIPGWWREHFIRLQRICILPMEGAPSPAEGIISHLRGLDKPQHSAERPAVKKF